MAIYLDTSVLVSAFVEDDHSEWAGAFLSRDEDFVISRWAEAEFSSALAFRVRRNALGADERRGIEQVFDDWKTRHAACQIDDRDLAGCRRLLQDEARLRTPDALHLAVVLRHGHQLATLDHDLSAAALRKGVGVIGP